MQKPLPLSVCMISGAEAPRIGRALESVAGWAAEIVVVLNEQVDDGTDQIALKYGAKVYREAWKGFIAQKNSCADKASNPGCSTWMPTSWFHQNWQRRSPRSFPPPNRVQPPMSSRAAHFIPAAGFAMATGIRTGSCGSGAAGPRAGRATIRTHGSR